MISETRGGTASANVLGQGCAWSIPEIPERPICLEWREGGRDQGRKKNVWGFCVAPYQSLEDLGSFSMRWEPLWG